MKICQYLYKLQQKNQWYLFSGHGVEYFNLTQFLQINFITKNHKT